MGAGCLLGGWRRVRLSAVGVLAHGDRAGKIILSRGEGATGVCCLRKFFRGWACPRPSCRLLGVRVRGERGSAAKPGRGSEGGL